MGQILQAPRSIPEPVYDFSANWKDNEARETEYLRQLAEYAKKKSKCPEAGEVVDFPMADSYARYMVLSLSPVKLIHVALGDAWHFQYANRVTKSDLLEKIAANRRIKSFLASKK